MGRNVVICTDGTWNTPDQRDRGRVVPSNVVKLSRALAARNKQTNVEQLLYYDPGVGTGGRWDRIKGGVFGVGLSENVTQAYRKIGEHYQDGDHLFLFGFSRGAFTARSLAGLIGLCGIPDPAKDSVDEIVAKAYEIYRMDPRKRGTERDDAAVSHLQSRALKNPNGDPVREVWFVGAWDTVGALGVPLQKINWLGRRKHKFHDVRLGGHIRHAYHAVAVDERRRPFKPTLWLDRGMSDTDVEQLWFSGVHSNVGGGYVDAGLSDRTLLWMCAKAKAAGLAFNDAYMSKRIDPNYHGELRDSMSLGYRALTPFLRPIGEPWLASDDGKPYAALNEGIHYSAKERHEHATEAVYRDSPGAVNLREALRADSPKLAVPLVEEFNFHRGSAGVSWDGDGQAPARL